MKSIHLPRTWPIAVLLLLPLGACGEAAPVPRPALPSGEAPRPRPVKSPVPQVPATSAAEVHEEDPAESEAPDTGSAPSSDAAPMTGSGVIAGVVTFEGDPPARKELAIGSTIGCEHDEAPLTEVVIVNDGKLANVFVYVSKGLKDWEGGASLPPLVLDQRGCIYQPHVSGAVVGQTVRASNSDSMAHNVHVIAKRNDSPNKTQSAGMKPLELVFKRDEVPVVFVCDIHPWMKAYVCVLEHPFFAVSAPDGSFRIEGLPPGEYSLTAWHEKYGKQKADKIVVGATGEASASFQFP